MATALNWTEDELPFPLTAIDRAQLKLTDEEYKPHTWEQLRQIVGWLVSLTQVAENSNGIS